LELFDYSISGILLAIGMLFVLIYQIIQNCGFMNKNLSVIVMSMCILDLIQIIGVNVNLFAIVLSMKISDSTLVNCRYNIGIRSNRI